MQSAFLIIILSGIKPNQLWIENTKPGFCRFYSFIRGIVENTKTRVIIVLWQFHSAEAYKYPGFHNI